MRSIALRPSWHRGSPVMGEKRRVGPKQIGLFDGSVCGVYISAMGHNRTPMSSTNFETRAGTSPARRLPLTCSIPLRRPFFASFVCSLKRTPRQSFVGL